MLFRVLSVGDETRDYLSIGVAGSGTRGVAVTPGLPVRMVVLRRWLSIQLACRCLCSQAFACCGGGETIVEWATYVRMSGRLLVKPWLHLGSSTQADQASLHLAAPRNRKARVRIRAALRCVR